MGILGYWIADKGKDHLAGRAECEIEPARLPNSRIIGKLLEVELFNIDVREELATGVVLLAPLAAGETGWLAALT